MQEDDAEYYRRRAEMEANLAERAEQPQAVAAHRQLAILYAERAEFRQSPQSMICDW